MMYMYSMLNHSINECLPISGQQSNTCPALYAQLSAISFATFPYITVKPLICEHLRNGQKCSH